MARNLRSAKSRRGHREGAAAPSDEYVRENERLRKRLADLTEASDSRSQAEQALRQSEQRYRAIVDSTTELICRNLPDGTLTFVNEAYCRCFGETAEQLIGKKLLPLIPDEDLPGVQAHLASLSPDNPVATHEHRIVLPNGQTRWQQWTNRAIFDEAGRVVEIQGAGRDITERKRAEEALRESEERFRNVYDTAPLAFVLWDRQCRITGWNDQAQKIFGWSRAEALGRSFFDFLVPESARPHIQGVVEQLLRGQLVRNVVNENLTKNGRTLLCEWNNSVLYDRDGEVIGAISLGLDITERKSLQAQLLQAQKMEAIGRLAGGVAHDFNNLLTPILGYAELLGQGELSAPAREDLQQIARAARRGADLARQLLAFGRKQTMELHVVGLNEVVAGCEKMLRRLIKENIEIDIRAGEALGSVQADPAQIEQVIVNLMINAGDAMPDGGAVTIETANVDLDAEYARTHPDAHAGPHVMLAVTDTGCGMDAETLKLIFEPFFSTKDKHISTGLGLATVHGIVNQHGGSIEVHSRPGEGASFRIFLPRMEAQPEGLGVEEPAAGNLRGSETILVVEDEPVLRRLTCRILAGYGYDILEAADPEKAVRTARDCDGPIQLLLTDVVMPVMNGQQLYATLHPDRPDMKALYMSGYSDDVVDGHGGIEGGIHFIQKPFSMDALAEKVRKALDG